MLSPALRGSARRLRANAVGRLRWPAGGRSRGAVILPDIPPHPSQLEALELIAANRRVALVAGRRWGKTSLLTMLAVDAALAGRSVGVFCPTYKFLGPLFEPIVSALRALPGVAVNRMLGEIRLLGGGAIDFWSLDYTARAGRGRRYHLALIDESAHDEGRLADSFPASIAPALLDFNGSVVTASTPNGLEGWFHDIVHDQRHGFAVFHAPTGANPFLPVEAIAALRAELPRPESRCKNWTRNSSTPAARRSSRWRAAHRRRAAPRRLSMSGDRACDRQQQRQGRPRPRRLRGGDLRRDHARLLARIPRGRALSFCSTGTSRAWPRAA